MSYTERIFGELPGPLTVVLYSFDPSNGYTMLQTIDFDDMATARTWVDARVADATKDGIGRVDYAPRVAPIMHFIDTCHTLGAKANELNAKVASRFALHDWAARLYVLAWQRQFNDLFHLDNGPS